MATKAGIWIRVSTGKQDEQNQEPDVLRHCEARGYKIARRYLVNDRSAYHGEQERELQKMLLDVRKRNIDVLVFWHSDRLERRGTEALFKDIADIREAGGRFESVLEPYLGKSDMEGTVMTAIAGATAHQYSAHLAQQVGIAVDRVRGNGALWGNSHRGYRITGEKYNKTLEPTKEGKRYIPEVFQRIADGESIHKVAAWLRSGPWPNIADRSVHRIIRNRVYMGQKMADGKVVMEVPPLVDAKLWVQANDRLDNSPGGRRDAITRPTALLTSVLFCPKCRKPDGKAAPMYRITAGRRPYKRDYYRCRGHAPELKSCGNMVPLDKTDFAVSGLLSLAQEPWTELRHIRGENYDSELAEVQLALNDLPKQGLTDTEEDAERQRLRAERDRLAELNEHATPDRWEEVETGETVGQHWGSLDYAGKRAMLLKEVRVFAEPMPPELRRAGASPKISLESRLFTLPVTWLSSEA